MKLQIIKQTPQETLKRTQVHARVHTGAQSPSRQEVANALAQELNADRSLVIVHKILPAFGDASAQVHARIYSDAEVMNTVERANLVEKNKKVEPEAPAQEEADDSDSEQEEKSE